MNPAPRKIDNLEIKTPEMMDFFFKEIIYPAPQKVTCVNTWMNPEPIRCEVNGDRNPKVMPKTTSVNQWCGVYLNPVPQRGAGMNPAPTSRGGMNTKGGAG